MGFEFAGSLTGAAPVVRRLQTGVTMYKGNLVISGIAGGLGGHVQLATVASETFEDDQPIIGLVSAVADESRTYVKGVSGTAGYGDRSTYTTTKATIAANLGTGLTGGGEVDVTLIIPGDTLVRAPIYDTVWGTALTELTVTTGNSNGITVTHANDTITDIADDYSTIYCRSGANRGHYRVNTTAGANANVATIPFPYTIVAGDVFVVASCVLGFGGMDITTGCDAIDGDNNMDAFYAVYYHEINLEESGKEYAIFSMHPWWGSITSS